MILGWHVGREQLIALAPVVRLRSIRQYQMGAGLLLRHPEGQSVILSAILQGKRSLSRSSVTQPEIVSQLLHLFLAACQSRAPSIDTMLAIQFEVQGENLCFKITGRFLEQTSTHGKSVSTTATVHLLYPIAERQVRTPNGIETNSSQQDYISLSNSRCQNLILGIHP